VRTRKNLSIAMLRATADEVPLFDGRVVFFLFFFLPVFAMRALGDATKEFRKIAASCRDRYSAVNAKKCGTRTGVTWSAEWMDDKST